MRADVGKVMMTPKGAYSPNTQYEIFDLVTNEEGSSYLAKAPSKGVPLTNTDKWEVLVDVAAAKQDVTDLKSETDELKESVDGIEAALRSNSKTETGSVVTINNPSQIIGVSFAIEPIEEGTSPKTITGHESGTIYLSGEDTQSATEIEIEFPVSAGIVYGGVVDTINKKLTVNKIGVDLGQLTWSVQTFSSTNKVFYVELPDAIPNIMLKASNESDYYCLCEKYSIVTYNAMAGSGKPLNSIAQRTNGVNRLYARTDDYDATNSPTGKAVFMCAEPVVYDLGDVTIVPVEGINKIWTTESNILVKYRESLLTRIEQNSEQIDSLSETVEDLQSNVDDNIASISTLSGEVPQKINLPVDYAYGEPGQLLRTNGDGTTEWVDVALPTDEQTAEAVSAWLDAHPEATTTIEDSAITEEKLANALKDKVIKDYVTPEMYGAKGDGETDDTTAIQAAINSGKYVCLTPGKTYIMRSVNIPHGLHINGQYSTLKRPNLKSDPYNWTDSQISWNRPFVIEGSNTNNLTTIIENITFDGNAFEMWEPSDGYKYEHGTIIAISGNATYRSRVKISGCKFINNFSSGMSIQNNAIVSIDSCEAYNCFMGIFTFVGVNSVLSATRFKSYTSYDSFNSINIEINSTDYLTGNRSDVFIEDAYTEGAIKLCAMVGDGLLTVRGLVAKIADDAYIDSAGVVDITDCDFALTSTGSLLVRPMRAGGADHRCVFNITNTRIRCIDETSVTQPISIRTQNIDNEAVRVDVNFTNCKFENLSRCIGAPNSIYHFPMSVTFNGCSFDGISEYIVGASGASSYGVYGDVRFIGCDININDDAYIVNDTNPNDGFNRYVFSGGNKVENENAGILLYGSGIGDVIFQDELWEHGRAISFSGRNKSHEGIGHRYRKASAIPSEAGFIGCDIAIVGGIKYIYTANGWVSQ